VAAEPPPQRLSDIPTVWTLLNQAHGESPAASAEAQRQILQRYRGAVYRYLLAAAGDAHVAEDLTQEFGLSLVRGDFHRVTPERGRFRDYVKTVLFHLMARHRDKQRRVPAALGSGGPNLQAVPAPEVDAEQEFREKWRQELLARAWERLRERNATYYAALRLRAEHAKVRSQELAERLARQLGKRVTAEGFRQAVHRAQGQLAEMLLDEVVHSLQVPTRAEVEQELAELGLLTYCQSALDRYSFPQP
jgi:RNA polymerase sigma factor (sigma-70 family)